MATDSSQACGLGTWQLWDRSEPYSSPLLDKKEGCPNWGHEVLEPNSAVTEGLGVPEAWSSPLEGSTSPSLDEFDHSNPHCPVHRPKSFQEALLSLEGVHCNSWVDWATA